MNKIIDGKYALLLIVVMLPILHFFIKYFSPPEKIDYLYLENLLRAGNWQKADEQTSRIMRLKVSKRNLFRIYLEGISIYEWEKFPCDDLFTIDSLWLKYSDFSFGFRLQQSIWGSPSIDSDEILDNLERFNQKVKWGQEKLDSFDLNIPDGHYPSSRWISESTPKIDGMYVYKLNSFFSRTRQCYLDLESFCSKK